MKLQTIFSELWLRLFFISHTRHFPLHYHVNIWSNVKLNKNVKIGNDISTILKEFLNNS